MPCDTCLPISAIHKVTVDRQQANFTRQGKGGHLILTSALLAGIGGAATVISAVDRSRTYSTLEDMALEWETTSTAYLHASASFAQVPSPTSVTIAWYDDTAPAIADELNLIYECVKDWFVVTTPDLVDDARQLDVASWVKAKSPRHVYSYLTKDLNTLVDTDTASIRYLMGQAKHGQLGNFISQAAFTASQNPYLDAEVAGIIATQNFDTGDGYTLWGQRPVGSQATPISQTQLDYLKSQNFNVKTCVAGTNVYYFGVLDDGSWLDDLHLSCWLQARMEEAQFEADITEGPRKYTEAGYYAVIDRFSQVFRDAQGRSLITGDRFNEQADQQRGYVINAPRYDQITSAQFSSREGVCISATTFSAGYIQGACLEIELRV